MWVPTKTYWLSQLIRWLVFSVRGGCQASEPANGWGPILLRRQFKNPLSPRQPQNPRTPTKKGQHRRGSYGWFNGEASLPNILDCSLNRSQAVPQFIFCRTAKSEVFDITQVCHPNKREEKGFIVVYAVNTWLWWLKSSVSRERGLPPPCSLYSRVCAIRKIS